LKVVAVPRGLPTFLLIILIAAGLGILGYAGMGSFLHPAISEAEDSPSPAKPLVAEGDPRRLRVMTANIRLSEPGDGINAWPNRRELCVKTMLKYNPDLIGCQEVTPAQGAYLVKELAPWYTQYPRAGVGKIEGDNGSHASQLLGEVTASFASLNTLFYRTDRFDQLDGTAGLVLPDQPQMIASENTFFTLAVLKQKANGKLLIVVDTHIRHQPAFATKCALKLREIVANDLKKYPGAGVILMGDINHDRTEATYRALAGVDAAADGLGVLTDSFDYSKKRPGESWGNWHAFSGISHSAWPSDLIFTSGGWSAVQTTIVRDAGEKGLWPSDHFFVFADLVGQ
jgi:endonuclease/exonuclease/phosphatase family metal-dependent hydrolase